MGVDEHPVSPDRLTLQVSAEDTFEKDLTLDQLEPHIRRLAEKTWAAHQREALGGRIARTVVLKLKTADFHTLTRSLTPSIRPRSVEELADLACAMRERVQRDEGELYRLVGVGLSGFVEQDSFLVQGDLFDLEPDG
jgi:DNA polymerase-4